MDSIPKDSVSGLRDLALIGAMFYSFGRVSAVGMAVFPNSTAEQREKGMTDFNDLALENARLAKHQLEEAVWCAILCEILKETPHRFLVRLGKDCLLPEGRQTTKGQEVYVPKDAIRQSMEVTR